MIWSTCVFLFVLAIGILGFVGQLTELHVVNAWFDLAVYALAQSVLFVTTIAAIGLTFLFARRTYRLKRIIFRTTIRVRRLNPRTLVKIASASGFLTLALFVTRLIRVTA